MLFLVSSNRASLITLENEGHTGLLDKFAQESGFLPIDHGEALQNMRFSRVQLSI